MKRRAVPVVAPAMTARVAARLRPLLTPRPAPVVYERKLQPLESVAWPRRAALPAIPGQVAMFDVADGGELQTW